MAYSKDLREKAIAHYENSSDSLQKTADIFGVSIRTLQDWRTLHQKGIDLQYQTSPGRPKKLNPQQEQRLAQLTEEFPDWTQQSFADALAKEAGIKINQQLVSETLQRLGITLKKSSGGQTKPKVIESKG